MTRQCIKCLQERPLTDFYPNPKMTLGVESRCKECAKAAKRASYYNHAEKCKAQNRDWRLRNRLRVKALDAANGANKRYHDDLISADDVLAIWERDGKCLRCGRQDRLSLDHIVNRGAGGRNVPSNLQTLCESCNKAKQ